MNDKGSHMTWKHCSMVAVILRRFIGAIFFHVPRAVIGAYLLYAVGAPLSVAAAVQTNDAVRIGTTPVFLDDQVAFIGEWQAYLQRRLQRPVEFVRRGSYGEIVELLQRGQLDFAWICGYPYVRFKQQFRLLAVPLFRGKPLYQSYLIVPHTDRKTQTLLDLKGAVFAYSDPNSNSGWLVPQYELRRAGIDPTAFFGKSFFTWAHRKVVEAVGSGLAHGGAVDGYVWETLAVQRPELTARTRVAWKSPQFGFPPLVAHRSVPTAAFEQVQAALLGMSQDEEGRALLKRLNLDGFAAGDDRLFERIEANMNAIHAR